MSAFIQFIRPAIALLALNTLLLGLAYPVLITLLLQGVFPQQANGSLIVKDGQVLGSQLIGQHFLNSGYFWSRPSATGPYVYNASSSSGSNLGAANPVLLENVQSRIEALGGGKNVPIDLVTASGSGLDPHISPAAAEYQIARVAKARGMKPETLRAMVIQHTEGRQFGLLGESRINVLKLNLSLDGKL